MNGSSALRALFLVAFILGFVGTAAAEVPRTGLVAEYHFDGDAKDSSGNGNDGTVYGATFVDGKLGKAISFDGVDDYVSTSLILNTVPKTYSAWIKLKVNDGNAHWIVGADNGAYNGHWLGVVNNKLLFEFCHQGGCDDYKTTTSLVYDNWYFVAASVTSTTVKVYVNGILENDASGISIGTVSAPAQGIGKHTSGDATYFNGIIDEVRIYNRALSDAEILALYDPSGDMAKQFAQAELDKAKNSALELINSVSTRVDMLKRDGVDTSLLEQALKNARDSYDAGKYADAYGFAQNAKKMADDAYAAFQVVKSARAEIDGAKAIGAAVPDAETKLNDAMDALNKGDYPRAQSWASEAAQLAKKASVGKVSIKDLKALATKYDQRSVEVSGTIRSIEAVYGTGYKFAVDDGTGMVSMNYGSSLSDIKDGDKVTASGLFQSSTGLIIADSVQRAGIGGVTGSSGTSMLAVVGGLVVLGLIFFVSKKKKK